MTAPSHAQQREPPRADPGFWPAPGYADIALRLALPGSLQFGVPESLRGKLRIGQRVLVPLRGGRDVGYVVGLSNEPKVRGIRPIERLLDPEPHAAARTARTHALDRAPLPLPDRDGAARSRAAGGVLRGDEQSGRPRAPDPHRRGRDPLRRCRSADPGSGAPRPRAGRGAGLSLPGARRGGPGHVPEPRRPRGAAEEGARDLRQHRVAPRHPAPARPRGGTRAADPGADGGLLADPAGPRRRRQAAAGAGRHRQRQDRALPARDPRPASRPAGPAARPRSLADHPADPPPARAAPFPDRGLAPPALGRREIRPLARDPPRRGAHGRRHALGALRAPAPARAHRRRRGAGGLLQAGGDPLLPRPRRGHRPRGELRRRGDPRFGDPEPREPAPGRGGRVHAAAPAGALHGPAAARGRDPRPAKFRRPRPALDRRPGRGAAPHRPPADRSGHEPPSSAATRCSSSSTAAASPPTPSAGPAARGSAAPTAGSRWSSTRPSRRTSATTAATAPGRRTPARPAAPRSCASPARAPSAWSWRSARPSRGARCCASTATPPRARAPARRWSPTSRAAAPTSSSGRSWSPRGCTSRG